MQGQALSLTFGDEIDSTIRSRIGYSFCVFAAVYGYRFVVDPNQADIRCTYGNSGRAAELTNAFRIPNLYKPSAPPRSLRRCSYAGQNFCLVYGVDETNENPDWLGEIFVWLTAGFERSTHERDNVGRIPYKATPFYEQKVSPLTPYAGLLMAWMENSIRGDGNSEALPRAKSHLPGVEHCVICSHDVDFSYTTRGAAFERLCKNMLIALSDYRDGSFFLSNAKMALQLLSGDDVGNYIPKMLDGIESLGFRSTIFAVADGKHRRDPNYRIEEIAPQLRDAVMRGFGVGLHASYESVGEYSTLGSEASALERAVGSRPMGSRQHWLRFDTHDKLFEAVRDAGLGYDTTLGFADTCGFRNGANFAFPPYDFRHERAFPFLEIPLVVMDGSLLYASRSQKEHPQEIVDRVMGESRRLGWGGIALLWHNPVEPIQVSERINRVFWKSASKRTEHREAWMSAEQFLKSSLERYQQANLLREVSLNAKNAN